MRLFILTLFVASLFQTTLLPINLVLLLLLARSLITEEKGNLWLAFLVGMLLGLFSGTNLGFWAVIFLFSVKLITLLKQLPIQVSLRTLLPIGLIIISLVNFLEWWLFKTSFSFSKVLTELLLSVPVYLMVRWWEERFVVVGEIKLKLRN